ncbi:MAG: VWA domain-containing protein [Planctomycetota bacterium]|nr:VWA domain-containing protein [Planctomycetota bacterium]MDA1139682.1 VWA domain-containing protein [Planctomycetota bacterium]
MLITHMLPELFRDWIAFLLLPLAVLPLVRALWLKGDSTMQFSSVRQLKRLKTSLSLRARNLLTLVRIAVLVLIVLALARPQQGKTETRIQTEGIDIALVVDCSLSMWALDLDNRYQEIQDAGSQSTGFFSFGRPRASSFANNDAITNAKNRLEVARDVILEFVKGRGGDRMGLFVFATSAHIQCPLTTNHGVLMDIVKRLKLPTDREVKAMQDRKEEVWGSQTAIGWGIATAAKRLADSKAKSKVMVLLTDGRNNVQDLTPETATEMATALGIKIYTIGAGTEDQSYRLSTDIDGAPSLVPMPRTELDEAQLKRIADATNGHYFRATDGDSLKKIYQEIDKLEKVTTEGEKYSEYLELFSMFLLPALGLLLVEIGLGNTRLRKLP